MNAEELMPYPSTSLIHDHIGLKLLDGLIKDVAWGFILLLEKNLMIILEITIFHNYIVLRIICRKHDISYS